MKYRKITPRLWGDERFRQLSRPRPSGQWLWLYLLTGPHTTAIPGLFAAGEAGLTEALGWSLSAFRAAWLEIERAGMARADWRARVVWIPKALLYNEPENPNVVKGWAMQLRELPECDLSREAAASIAAYLIPKGPAWLEAWTTSAKPFAKPFSQESTEGSAKGFGKSGAVAGAVTGTGTGERDSLPLPPLSSGRPTDGRPPSRKAVNLPWAQP
jgi:hypothetical protein